MRREMVIVIRCGAKLPPVARVVTSADRHDTLRLIESPITNRDEKNGCFRKRTI